MTLNLIKNNKLVLKSIISHKLTNKEINEICSLKDKQWKFGIKSQFKWFKDNIKEYAPTISEATGIDYLYKKIRNLN